VIEAVELRRVSLPLVAPFRTAFGIQTTRDALLVHVLGDCGEGWGECVAMAEPTYSSEYVESAHQVMRQHLVPRLLAARGDIDALAPVRGHLMAKAALETAVLDASLRAQGVGLAQHLGGVRASIEAGVSVGITHPLDALLDAVGSYLEAGYRRVKLKIEPGWDVAPVGAVRERFGHDLLLQVDANASYATTGGDGLAALDPLGLLLVEQPLAEDDLLGHAALAASISTPICLDESITSARVAELAIGLGACSIVNIKPGRVGGLHEARRIHDLCLARGVAVWCGGMLETGIGRAANLALAALPGFTLPADLSASDRYFHLDVTPPFVLAEGRILVPTGPGIGVDVLPDVLAELTTSVEVVTI
jgi:o-succinylbenzoate synthase